MVTMNSYDRYCWTTQDGYWYWWRFNPKGCAHRILEI